MICFRRLVSRAPLLTTSPAAPSRTKAANALSISAAVRAGNEPDPAAYSTRGQRAACRIALRQLRKLDGASLRLERWLREFDIASVEERAGVH